MTGYNQTQCKNVWYLKLTKENGHLNHVFITMHQLWYNEIILVVD